MSLDFGHLTRDYGDPWGEAHACRTGCALFDFSFLARVRLEGAGARELIEGFVARSLRSMAPGHIRYAVRRDPDDNLVADLTVWCLDDETYDVMSGRHDDAAFLVAQAHGACRATDLSGDTSVLALQGPGTLAVLSRLTDVEKIAKLAYFASSTATIDGVDCRVGRLGYTGEPGVEIILSRQDRPKLWEMLGRHARVAGFVAADMLRIEAGFVMFANEFALPAAADECGLGRLIDRQEEPRDGPVRLVCFRATTYERPVLWRRAHPARRPREAGTIIVTSACHSLRAGGTLGLGFVRAADIASGVPITDPTGVFQNIAVVSLPFYDPEKRRPHRLWSQGIIGFGE